MTAVPKALGNLVRAQRPIVLAYAVMVALFVIVSAASPGFASPSHLRTIVQLASFIAIVGIGQTFVIIGGGIDLSVPWALNGSAVLLTTFTGGHSAQLAWVIPALLAMGALVGLVNGLGVAYLRVSPIIMTLGMYAILEGGLLVFTHGGASKRSPHAIVSLATGRWGPFPILLVLWIVLGAAALFALSRTVFGRQLYAVGNNAEVAELSGVHVKRVTVLTYVVSGLTAVIAGILLTGYTGTAYLGMGDPYLFASVAAVAIGGASILGGSGHYAGTIAGALTLTILSALLPILNLKPAVLQIIYGLVILLTVGATTVRTRGRT